MTTVLRFGSLGRPLFVWRLPELRTPCCEVKLVCRSYQLILRSSASLLAHATPQCFYFRPVCLAVYFGLCSMLGKCIPREPV